MKKVGLKKKSSRDSFYIFILGTLKKADKPLGTQLRIK